MLNGFNYILRMKYLIGLNYFVYMLQRMQPINELYSIFRFFVSFIFLYFLAAQVAGHPMDTKDTISINSWPEALQIMISDHYVPRTVIESLFVLVLDTAS
jgi:hypothetical protein